KSGCGCGSLILGTIATIAGILIWNSFSGDKKIEQAKQPVAQPRLAAAVLPVQKADDPKPNDQPVTKEESVEPAAKTEPVSKSNDEMADEELRMVELLIGNNRFSPTRRRLKELIEKYPDTEAARKAK